MRTLLLGISLLVMVAAFTAVCLWAEGSGLPPRSLIIIGIFVGLGLAAAEFTVLRIYLGDERASPPKA